MQPDLSTAQTGCGRDPLIAAITAFLARDHAPALGEIRESLEREIDAAGPAALTALGHRLADPGSGWSYYPGDPLARRIHRALAGRVLVFARGGSPNEGSVVSAFRRKISAEAATSARASGPQRCAA